MEEEKIIFEDKNILVVEKEAGLTTTREKSNESWTLEDELKKIRPNSLPRNGIVHRLDKGSSGLILVAKTGDSLLNLKSQFKNRMVIKKYYCLVSGEVPVDGEINMPIGRSKFGFGKFAVDWKGKESRTLFRLLGKYKKNDKIFSFLEVDLKTGRTHQIRVHMSYLGWPLVGDKLYGGDDSSLNHPFLHSFFIQFSHPVTGKVISFKSELPNDLQLVLSQYEKV